MTLTTDEKNLIRIYDAGCRIETINFLPAVQFMLMLNEEQELYDLIDSVLDKLERMTDAEYDALIAEPLPLEGDDYGG